MRYSIFGTHKGLCVYELAGFPNPLPNPLSNV
jgi:hypothetical protein